MIGELNDHRVLVGEVVLVLKSERIGFRIGRQDRYLPYEVIV